MKALTFGDISIEPGETRRGRLGSVYLFDGTRVDIPLAAVRGKQDGPVFWLSAAMHGQELSGIGVIWEVLKQLDPNTLRGTVVAAPLLNPLSFSGGTYFTPQDGYNMDHVFPGNPKGGITDRLVSMVVEEGIKKADYLIDFHCNPDPAMCFTKVVGPIDSEPGRTSMQMAEAFGISNFQEDCLPSTGVHSGTMDEAAALLGKPMIGIELTPWWRISPLMVQVGARGTLNVLKTLGMIDGALEKQEGIPILPGFMARGFLLSDRGGLVKVIKQPAERLKKGELICQVVDNFGDPVEDIVSPHDGWMVAYPMLFSSAAYTGEYVAYTAFERK